MGRSGCEGTLGGLWFTFWAFCGSLMRSWDWAVWRACSSSWSVILVGRWGSGLGWVDVAGVGVGVSGSGVVELSMCLVLRIFGMLASSCSVV